MTENAIHYKVVEKGTRHCSNWTMFKNQSKGYSEAFVKKVIKFRKENKEYFPRYFRGRTVTAPEGSAGIMCFKTEAYAKKFIRNYIGTLSNTIIIKVQPIGGITEGRNLRLTGGCGGIRIIEIKDYVTEFDRMSAPSGTVAFPAVKVLT